MKKLSLCFGILLTGWLLTPFAAAQSADQQPVGIIDNFDGKPTDYLLERKGEVKNYAPAQALQNALILGNNR